VSSFPEAKIKSFIREECLREESGKSRIAPDRVLRVLFLIKEGVSADAAPLWHREFNDGENTEETVDVDGLVARIRNKVDNEVSASSVANIFRLCAIHGSNSAITPSLVSAQIPFTVHPIRRIGPRASADGGSPYAQSFEDATETGLSALMMRGMKMTQEIYFPEIQNLILEKNETIDGLRTDLRTANTEIRDLRTRLDEAEDKRTDRIIRLRDSALKQRLKERGGRLVINALTLLASQWMAPGGAGGGGGGGAMGSGNGQNPPQMGRGSNAAIGGNREREKTEGKASEGKAAEGQQAQASEQQPEQQRQQPEQQRQARSNGDVPPPPPGFAADDVIWLAANAARNGKPFDLAPVFGEFVKEIIPALGSLQGAVSPDQQGLLMQAFQVYSDSGRVDTLVLQRFAEDLGEDGDLTRLHKLIDRLPTSRAKMAFATVLAALRKNYDVEREDDKALEHDLQKRVNEVTQGEFIDDEPEIPEDPTEDIQVRKPRIVSKEEAAEDRKKKRACGVTVREVDKTEAASASSTKRTDRDKPL
jgi:hypothetical protein